MRVLVVSFFAAMPLSSSAATSAVNMMPLAAESHVWRGTLVIDDSFSVAILGKNDARLHAALDLMLAQWEQRSNRHFSRNAQNQIARATGPDHATLTIRCERLGPAIPELSEDESYTLHVDKKRAEIRAETTTGALRGLASLTQLFQVESGASLPAVQIHDQPRFPWRGLLIDVARHWQPMEVIKRNLDGMALVKLNVLHLHLCDDQGFRVESKTYPELNDKASDGLYFTQAQIRELIAYAAARGIRIVPEFDVPGHATSWLVAFPDLASGPTPRELQRRWGVFDPVLDPTNEAVYTMLDRFFGEMAELFPDPFLHIGGDENNGVQWSANAKIQAFIREHGLKDNAGLHAYFNQRVQRILAKYNKRVIGWDEILHPSLPTEAVIQSWRGPEGLVQAARAGHRAILSAGYYIDLNHPASDHYAVDPLPANTSLDRRDQARVLGGEATMWSEWVTPELIDSRIWPRAAAIAERLWSPREVSDVEDMYRRLGRLSLRLEELGLQHERYLSELLRNLAKGEKRSAVLQALRILVDSIEPVQDYRRGGLQPAVTQQTPLRGLVDCARPDSTPSRLFNGWVETYLFGENAGETGLGERIHRQLDLWAEISERLQTDFAAEWPGMKNDISVPRALALLSRAGAEAMIGVSGEQTPPPEWGKETLSAIEQASEPGPAAVVLPMSEGIKLLVAAADLRDQRQRLSREAWAERVRARASGR